MATNVANSIDNQYFYEDVVYRVDKKGNVEFGIIMVNDDQDMSDDSSANEESPKRKKGEIRVVWHPSGVEELVNSKKVKKIVYSFESFCFKPNLPFQYLLSIFVSENRPVRRWTLNGIELSRSGTISSE